MGREQIARCALRLGTGADGCLLCLNARIPQICELLPGDCIRRRFRRGGMMKRSAHRARRAVRQPGSQQTGLRAEKRRFCLRILLLNPAFAFNRPRVCRLCALCPLLLGSPVLSGFQKLAKLLRALLSAAKRLLRLHLPGRLLAQLRNPGPRLFQIPTQLSQLFLTGFDFALQPVCLCLGIARFAEQRLHTPVIRQFCLQRAHLSGQIVRFLALLRRRIALCRPMRLSLGRLLPLRSDLLQLLPRRFHRLGMADAFAERSALRAHRGLARAQLLLALFIRQKALPGHLLHAGEDRPAGLLRKGTKCLFHLRGDRQLPRILQCCALGLLKLSPKQRRPLRKALLQRFKALGVKDAPENRAPLIGSRQQQALKIALGDHANLRKLLPRQPDQFFDLARHIPAAGGHMPIGPGELRIGLLRRGATAAPPRPLVFRHPPRRIALSPELKRQPDVRLHVGPGVFASQHRAAAVRSARLPVEGKRDGIEYRRLSCARVARNQVQPAFAQPVKRHLRLLCIRPESAHLQQNRSHASSSQIVSIMPVSSERCGAVICVPFCAQYSASNSSSGVRVTASRASNSA